MNLFKKLFPPRPPDSALTLARNDNCWCGSGKKYKACHLEKDLKYFNKVAAAACRTGG